MWYWLFEYDSSQDGFDLRNSGADSLRSSDVNETRSKKNEQNGGRRPSQVLNPNILSTQVKQVHPCRYTVVNDTIHDIWQESHDDAQECKEDPVFANSSKCAIPYPRQAVCHDRDTSGFLPKIVSKQDRQDKSFKRH